MKKRIRAEIILARAVLAGGAPFPLGVGGVYELTQFYGDLQ